MRPPLFLFLAALALTGCGGHLSQIKSAQGKAATAKVNAILARDAVWMKVADYGLEAAFANALPATPATQKTTAEILGLQTRLLGHGKMTPAQREAFVRSLVKDDLTSKGIIVAHQIQDDAALKKAAAADIRADKAEAKVYTMAQEDAVAADHFGELKRNFFLAIGALFLIYVLHVLYTLGVFGATVASKVP